MLPYTISAMARLPLLPGEEGYWYPNWRIAWEEDLDETTRRRIRRAVRAGRVLDDPYEAAFAVTLAVKERRVWRWWPIFTILFLGWAVFQLVTLFWVQVADWNSADWFRGVVAIVVIVLYPPLAFRNYKHLVRAEHLNRQVVGQNRPSEST